MSLSTEAQALYDHAKQSLPRWLTEGKNSVREWLYGFVSIFDPVRSQGQDWLDITFITNASGVELDQHALDRGTIRRDGEDDATLRLRLISIQDAVTEPAIKTAVDILLAANGLGPCTIVNLRRDRGHYQQPLFGNMFYSRGYRMSYAGRPAAYIVILPYGTSGAIGDSVSEYLRQYGPGGFAAIVEIRANP